ncbi:MAG: hypothetical protein L0H59_17200 [Tomitella sp.]|nr:hypothetical protein [Tomitella sp.]
MQGQALGSSIAAGFGLIYVIVNTDSMPPAVQWTLRTLAAAAAAAAVLLAVVRHRAKLRSEPSQSEGSVFGRRYWWVVIVEVIALFVGVRLLAGPFDMPQAGVAWVSMVVGLNFFPLATIFAQRFFHILGVAISLCGSAGLALALADAAPVAIDLVSGVIPGGILLAFGWWGAGRRTPHHAIGR